MCNISVVFWDAVYITVTFMVVVRVRVTVIADLRNGSSSEWQT